MMVNDAYCAARRFEDGTAVFREMWELLGDLKMQLQCLEKCGDLQMQLNHRHLYLSHPILYSNCLCFVKTHVILMIGYKRSAANIVFKV